MFGTEAAELPLVATRKESQGKASLVLQVFSYL